MSNGLSDVVEEIRALQRRLYELQKRVAAQGVNEDLPQGEVSLLLAELGAERVALPLEALQEALPMAELTPLAEAPVWVAGLLNLRGELVPVIDLQARMEGRPREAELSDLILVCELDQRRVGLIVQGVAGIQQLSGEDIHPRPRDVLYAPYLVGTLHWEEQPVLLVSLPILVSTSDVPAVEQ